MPGFTDDGLRQYAYNTHLRWLETQLFNFMAGRSADQYQQLAREDVRRDLRQYGYIDPLDATRWPLAGYGGTETLRGEIANASSKAEALIVVTNPSADPVTLPAGAMVQDLDPYGDADSNVTLDSARGAYRWETLAAITIGAGETEEVAVRATVAGAPHNVCSGSQINDELGKMYPVPSTSIWAAALEVEWGELTTLGVDHQLARLVCYRALAFAYQDLVNLKDDPSDYKRQIYEQRYKDELKRTINSGVAVTIDGNADTNAAEDALRYGIMRLSRS